MLCYRGISKIDDWNLNDIDQVLRDLVLCQMSASSARGMALHNIESDATPEEWKLYSLVIDAIYKFIKELKDNGVEEFDNPPVTFVVRDNTVSLHPSREQGQKTKYFHFEIASTIEEALPSNYIVKKEDELWSYESEKE